VYYRHSDSKRQAGTLKWGSSLNDTKQTKRQTCPVEWTLEVIGGKWKCVILWHVRGRVRRFSDLRRLIPSATQKMLTAQLRQLERDGLIERKVFAEVPPRVEYSISEYGSSLSPLLEIMCKWGLGHRERAAASRSEA
jgi:DNA-binding HxlR family transcriptional regulator